MPTYWPTLSAAWSRVCPSPMVTTCSGGANGSSSRNRQTPGEVQSGSSRSRPLGLEVAKPARGRAGGPSRRPRRAGRRTRGRRRRPGRRRAWSPAGGVEALLVGQVGRGLGRHGHRPPLAPARPGRRLRPAGSRRGRSGGETRRRGSGRRRGPIPPGGDGGRAAPELSGEDLLATPRPGRGLDARRTSCRRCGTTGRCRARWDRCDLRVRTACDLAGDACRAARTRVGPAEADSAQIQVMSTDGGCAYRIITQPACICTDPRSRSLLSHAPYYR